MARAKFETIDQYIASFPKDTQAILTTVRETIRKAVPDANEGISYQIPTFKLNGKHVLYFAAFKAHYSVFGASQAVRTRFRKELAGFEQAKGTIQFPFDKPVPVKLIRDLAKAQAAINRAGGDLTV
jgi:uncharacterized protein YdhG (YjbR/CyaY superfamily)